MAVDGLTLEELSDYVQDGEKVKAWRTRATSALDSIDVTFNNIEAAKVKYAADPVIMAELNALVAQLKSAMFTIYDAH